MFTNTPIVQTFRIVWAIGTLRCDFTKFSRKTFGANALKVTFFGLNAGAANARRRLTLVDHLLAVVSAEAGSALARVRSVIVEANSVVLAGVPGALVDVSLAQIASVASLTAVARKSADFVDADAVILARIRLAIIEISLAPAAEEAIQAVTLVDFAVRWNAARPVIQARILLAQWM